MRSGDPSGEGLIIHSINATIRIDKYMVAILDHMSALSHRPAAASCSCSNSAS